MAFLKLKLSPLIPLLFFLNAANAQHVEKHLILTLPDNALTQQNACVSFGPGDSYCYYSRDTGARLLYTRSGTYGPFKNENNRGWGHLFWNVKGKGQYIKNYSGGEVYGPYDGEVDYASTSEISGLAYTVSAGDSITYYINGARIAVTDSSTVIGRWCKFSKNGSVLYTIRHGAWNYLYFSGRLLDSSRHYYSLNDIDDAGNYWYTLGDYKLNEGRCNSFYNFIAIGHKAEKRPGLRHFLGDTPLTWNRNDTFSLYGNTNNAGDHEDDSIAGMAYSFMKEARNIFNADNLLIKGHAVFCYVRSQRQSGMIYAAHADSTKIFINGTTKNLPYAEIYLPCIDSSGHYALFGRRGYYLYKNVDGVEVTQPLSKYGVRAMPISIDVRGNSICYYATEDSVYVYENDRLFRACRAAQFDCTASNYNVWHAANNKQPPVLNIDSATYIVYNNVLSPSLLRVGKNDGGRLRLFRSGDIICAKANEYGYYVIQKTGSQKYDLIINNQRMELPDGVNFEGPLWDDLTFNIQFSGKSFLFYSLEGINLYRYKMEL